ncbi:response regulator [Rubrivivax rivuli]|uniref:Response regulator transcription factor n=1 Tax=Rubrivivax rivuli TaxID=1862385 RepID=A0A437RD03_9BURK|nr:response regulator transcription factor [Rubrivivax rivuli]RVU44638.1 response regulator transcription factor [Rubrivivax rivuli]
MKVLLVDDHPLVLSALQQVIQRVGSGTTVMGVDSAAAARAALAQDSDYDLVLLDLALGDADGFDVLVEFRAAYPAVPVVVVSASDRASDVIRAIDSGAMGFVPKRSSHGELHEALRMVMTGAMYVPPSMLGLDFSRAVHMGDTVPGVMRSGPDSGFMAADTAPLGPAARPEPHQKVPTLADVGLTPRQSEVLSLLLQGLPNKLIARQLNLSVETVKDHVAAVLRALGVSSRTQAVLAVSQMTQGQGGSFAWRLPPR